MTDNVNNPQHYKSQSVLLEPIDVLRWAPFDLGNAIKYAIRAGHKNDELEDLQKGLKYTEWAIEGCDVNPQPYEKFLNKYRLLLGKFKALSWLSSSRAYFGIDAFLEDLKEFFEKRIKALQMELAKNDSMEKSH